MENLTSKQLRDNCQSTEGFAETIPATTEIGIKAQVMKSYKFSRPRVTVNASILRAQVTVDLDEDATEALFFSLCKAFNVVAVCKDGDS